jgi:hypothetical protein
MTSVVTSPNVEHVRSESVDGVFMKVRKTINSIFWPNVIFTTETNVDIATNPTVQDHK